MNVYSYFINTKYILIYSKLLCNHNIKSIDCKLSGLYRENTIKYVKF